MLTLTIYSDRGDGNFGGYCPPETCGVCKYQFMSGQDIVFRVVSNNGGMPPIMVVEAIHKICVEDDRR